MTRQVELQGSELIPIAAASLDEWQRAQQAGGLAEYERMFGITAGLPVSQWEGHEPDQLTAQEFEAVWDAARRAITARHPVDQGQNAETLAAVRQIDY